MPSKMHGTCIEMKFDVLHGSGIQHAWKICTYIKCMGLEFEVHALNWNLMHIALKCMELEFNVHSTEMHGTGIRCACTEMHGTGIFDVHALKCMELEFDVHSTEMHGTGIEVHGKCMELKFEVHGKCMELELNVHALKCMQLKFDVHGKYALKCMALGFQVQRLHGKYPPYI